MASGLDAKISDFVSKSDDGEDVENTQQAVADTYEPQYKMLSDLRIPISKGHGKLWESRKRAAVGKIKDGKVADKWDTALAYYRNDHGNRRDNADVSSDSPHGTTLASQGKETENLVFANATSLVPSVYAKNPKVEITCAKEEEEPFGDTLEKLVNVLIDKRAAPGVNLKPKARRAVLMSTLTNVAYVEVGYTPKEESSEETIKEIKKIGDELKKAKKRDIPELEAKLIALEEKVDLLHSAGPWVKFRKPHDVLIDPDANEIEEARWLMIADYLDTEYLKVMYGEKGEEGEYKSVFKPSHVLKLEGAGAGGVDGEIASFSLFAFDAEKTGTEYGFDDEKAFRKGCRTKVWYVWDKATRRVYLYNDADWTWPLWVWDDPYQYDNFFPLIPLEFYIDPTELYGTSETMMMLDQQDAVNAINNEIAKVREFAMGKAVYNSNVLKDENAIESFLSGTSRKRALGVDAPPDTDLTKAFTPFMPQSAHVLNTVVFDKERLIQAIDRVTSVTNVMRGVEYKTNTTNKAIESYESNTASRLDEKIDAIEDFIGAIGWKIAQLCIKEMDPETVGKLIGPAHAEVWAQKPELQEFQTFYSCACVGGSTLKPTTANKKQQALQLGQILGQFASATPMALLVALKIMERSFDEVVIRKEEWQKIEDAITQAIQGQGAGSSSEGQSPGAAQQGGDDKLGQVEQIIDQLPPPAKEMLAKLLLQGAPIRDAVGMVVQELQNANPDEMGVQE